MLGCAIRQESMHQGIERRLTAGTRLNFLGLRSAREMGNDAMEELWPSQHSASGENHCYPAVTALENTTFAASENDAILSSTIFLAVRVALEDQTILRHAKALSYYIGEGYQAATSIVSDEGIGVASGSRRSKLLQHESAREDVTQGS